MDNLLKDKVAVITGGAGGIGRATAEMFADQGARIVVLDKSRENLDRMSADFGEKGWSLTTVEGDAETTADLRKLMEQTDSAYGRLDVLVNNVGDFLGLVKPLEKMSDDDIDKLMSVNLRHIMIASREALPLMRRSGEGGSIIAISSVEGFRGMPNITPYGVAKAGVTGFAQSLALEVGQYGIRVNVIAPETTETEQVRPADIMTPEDYQRQKQWLPLGRFGQPRDTAGCALFLASDLSAWVTGSTIHCDGGALAAAGWYRTPEGHWTNTPLVEGSAIPNMVQDSDD